jgi:hypothetical protein
LPRSRSWILERAIPGAEQRDAMGPYPLFACPDWSRLAEDLDELEGQIVSLVLVTDPFHPAEEKLLARLFSDRALRFKDHFIVDVTLPFERRASEHHRRYARAARRNLTIEHCADPMSVAVDWIRLYVHLIERHDIRGITRFSPALLEQQLALPDLFAFRASDAEGAVAMALFLRAGDHAYYHLGASSPRGYAQRASFGLFALALEHLADRGVRCVDLGAGPSTAAGEGEGLVRFKRGFATGSLPTWLCGRIFDREAYAALVSRHGGGDDGSFFPAYRRGDRS